MHNLAANTLSGATCIFVHFYAIPIPDWMGMLSQPRNPSDTEHRCSGGCWGGGGSSCVVKTGLQLLLPSEWQWLTAWSMHATTTIRVAPQLLLYDDCGTAVVDSDPGFVRYSRRPSSSSYSIHSSRRVLEHADRQSRGGQDTTNNKVLHHHQSKSTNTYFVSPIHGRGCDITIAYF